MICRTTSLIVDLVWCRPQQPSMRRRSRRKARRRRLKSPGNPWRSGEFCNFIFNWKLNLKGWAILLKVFAIENFFINLLPRSEHLTNFGINLGFAYIGIFHQAPFQFQFWKFEPHFLLLPCKSSYFGLILPIQFSPICVWSIRA